MGVFSLKMTKLTKLSCQKKTVLYLRNDIAVFMLICLLREFTCHIEMPFCWTERLTLISCVLERNMNTKIEFKGQKCMKVIQLFILL